MADNSPQSALTEAVFYLLLCVYHRPLHGYGIMQNVLALTNGRLNLGAGTLYGAINSMLEKGWIMAAGIAGEKGKKEYCITPEGRRVAQRELERLAEVFQNACAIMGEETEDEQYAQ